MGGASGQNPSDAASKYLNQIPGTITPYYQPYINAGQGAMGDLQAQYKQLLSNPTAIMNQIGGQFKESPGYQYNVNQATIGANNAAAASGMAGSPAEQAGLAGTISGLASQDYNNFMNQGLGLYGQGLGVAGNINQMGYNASNSLATDLAQNLMSQASNAYSGAQYDNQNSGGFLGGLGNLGMTALGYGLGGPAGGMMAGGMSGLFGRSSGGGGSNIWDQYGNPINSASDLSKYLSPTDFM